MAGDTAEEEHKAATLRSAAELDNTRPAATLRGTPTKVSAAACTRLHCTSGATICTCGGLGCTGRVCAPAEATHATRCTLGAAQRVCMRIIMIDYVNGIDRTALFIMCVRGQKGLQASLHEGTAAKG